MPCRVVFGIAGGRPESSRDEVAVPGRSARRRREPGLIAVPIRPPSFAFRPVQLRVFADPAGIDAKAQQGCEANWREIRGLRRTPAFAKFLHLAEGNSAEVKTVLPVSKIRTAR
jgi:hypothetical protein